MLNYVEMCKRIGLTVGFDSQFSCLPTCYFYFFKHPGCDFEWCDRPLVPALTEQNLPETVIPNNQCQYLARSANDKEVNAANPVTSTDFMTGCSACTLDMWANFPSVTATKPSPASNANPCGAMYMPDPLRYLARDSAAGAEKRNRFVMVMIVVVAIFSSVSTVMHHRRQQPGRSCWWWSSAGAAA
jgi:hypothetical protein